MNTAMVSTKKAQGQRLKNTEKLVIISKLIDHLSKGYYTSYKLSKMLNVSRQTIETYRPLADKLIAEKTLNRNTIRNLQVQRTYNIIENLMLDLKTCDTIKEKTLIYNQIAKFSQHLALITGLNIETHVNVDQQQLVIIRADNKKKPIIDESGEAIKQKRKAEMITIKDEPSTKQGHQVK